MRDEPWLDALPARRRPGLFFGVCRWLADRLGIAAFWVRLAVLVAAWMSGWWPVAAIYLAAAILLGRGSAARLPDVSRWRLPGGFHAADVADLRRRCDRLERRCHDVEGRLRRERTWDDLLRRPV